MNRYVCLHGHFYQPPRENAWLDEVEKQDSAYPYHDWNERITAECYAPNAASRILDADKTIIDIVNNYAKISFNFGPTLLAWMERHAPEIYRAILEADRESQRRFSGHGSAIAQVYNHAIMPLANARDKRTQVIWGLRDFEHRFERQPEGMWLAETAVDIDTLEALAENGIGFTILAPHQAARVRRPGRRWAEVSGAKIDTRRAYLCNLPSGKTIRLFFYDGIISRDIAFNKLLSDGGDFAHRLRSGFKEFRREAQLIHAATDGETYGHHHKFGEMALSYCLYHLEEHHLATLTVYGEFLDRFPPEYEVEILENTSWSCAHGIERWRNNCGCNSGRAGCRQGWRAPLREGLNELNYALVAVYEERLSPLVRDIWQARDAYITVMLNRKVVNVERFFTEHAARLLTREEKVTALRLLEMQRHAQLMFTSCGWFFDEISGLETTQVLQYAARAIQLGEIVSGTSFEPLLLEHLRRAPSNEPAYGNGAEVYEQLVKPASVDPLRVGAHYGISSLFEEYQETEAIYSYIIEREQHERLQSGKQKLAIGKIRMRSNITWSEDTVSFAVAHLGDHNLIGGVRHTLSDEAFQAMRESIKEAFAKSDVPEIIRLVQRHFEGHNYSLWHLFQDEKRKVFGRILESTLEEIRGSFRRIYNHYYPMMAVMRELHTPIPKPLMTAAEFTINTDLRRVIEMPRPDIPELEKLVAEVKKWAFEVDAMILAFITTRRLDALMEEFSQTPANADLLLIVEALLRAIEPLRLDIKLAKAQNILFSEGKQLYAAIGMKAEHGDLTAKEWIERFESLGDYLRVRSA